MCRGDKMSFDSGTLKRWRDCGAALLNRIKTEKRAGWMFHPSVKRMSTKRENVEQMCEREATCCFSDYIDEDVWRAECRVCYHWPFDCGFSQLSSDRENVFLSILSVVLFTTRRRKRRRLSSCGWDLILLRLYTIYITVDRVYYIFICLKREKDARSKKEEEDRRKSY